MIFQVLGVAVAVWLFVATWQVWVLAFVALIIAAAILPAARVGERWRVPRGLVVLAVYIVAVGVFTLMGRLLWPALSEQWTQFIDQLPKLVENVRGWLGNVDYWLGQWGASLPAPKADKVQGLAEIVLGNAMRLTTGALAAVLNVVPFVGATVATVLATLSALNDGIVRAGITLPVMVLCQTIEGKLLAPYFVGRATGLHALAVLLALLAGFHLAGLVGGLVAVPLLAGAWEIVRTLWVEPRRGA